MKHKSRRLCLLLKTVIPATQEAEIRRIMVRSQSGQKCREALSQKNPSQKKGLVE
jgi:hypothetical protein